MKAMRMRCLQKLREKNLLPHYSKIDILQQIIATEQNFDALDQ